jgi:transposase
MPDFIALDVQPEAEMPARDIRIDRSGALAGGISVVVRSLAARVAALIRVDAVWLATEPIDMRAGTETALARVVKVFGAAQPHHAYLFANRRANRMKVLVHDGIGIWLCARRLNQGRFLWANASLGSQLVMTREQLDALVLGLPWQRIGSAGVITVV